MGDFLDSASKILAQSQWRVETAAQNIANGTTPGYKRRVAYADFANNLQTAAGLGISNNVVSDSASGKIIETGASTDLAILGDGFFVVRDDAGVYFTRHGQFSRDAEGRLTAPGGMALQLEGGGDARLKGGEFSITADGTILQDGEPTGRLALVTVPDGQLAEGPGGGLFLSRSGETGAADKASVRQGALESSNVTMGEEMVVMMEALRRAESAQRLVNVYDELLGRAISSFGQG